MTHTSLIPRLQRHFRSESARVETARTVDITQNTVSVPNILPWPQEQPPEQDNNFENGLNEQQEVPVEINKAGLNLKNVPYEWVLMIRFLYVLYLHVCFVLFLLGIAAYNYSKSIFALVIL